MSAPDNGGAAFPQFAKCGDVAVSEGGLTLRDYFAAKAMQAAFQSMTANHEMEDKATIAEIAYMLADAMLEARK